MRREKDEFDPSLPTLVVTYGNTTRKHRVLDSDMIVLGRSNLCDFGLVSPEVAQVHCVLAHVVEGWRLRDCSGRPGTRVNGRVVHDTLLDDGDIIQIGAFTFQVSLPTGHTPMPANGVPERSPARNERLQRSRRRLAERALALRRRLREQARAMIDERITLARERVELHQLSESLRTKQRDFELRMTRLELSERDLATDRSTLEKEYRALQEEIQLHASNVRLTREEAVKKEQELEERQRRARNAVVTSAAPATELNERERRLVLREKELEHLARHLRRRGGPEDERRSITESLRDQQAALAELVVEVREALQTLGRQQPRDRQESGTKLREEAKLTPLRDCFATTERR